MENTKRHNLSLLRVLWFYKHLKCFKLELCLWSTGWQSPIHQPHQGDSYQGRKKCCHGSLLPTDSRSRDHTLASWTHIQGNTDEYWPLQLGQVQNMLFIVDICCQILFNFKVWTGFEAVWKIQRKLKRLYRRPTFSCCKTKVVIYLLK